MKPLPAIFQPDWERNKQNGCLLFVSITQVIPCSGCSENIVKSIVDQFMKNIFHIFKFNDQEWTFSVWISLELLNFNTSIFYFFQKIAESSHKLPAHEDHRDRRPVVLFLHLQNAGAHWLILHIHKLERDIILIEVFLGPIARPAERCAIDFDFRVGRELEETISEQCVEESGVFSVQCIHIWFSVLLIIRTGCKK